MIETLIIIDFQENIILLENPGSIDKSVIEKMKEKLLHTCKQPESRYIEKYNLRRKAEHFIVGSNISRG